MIFAQTNLLTFPDTRFWTVVRVSHGCLFLHSGRCLITHVSKREQTSMSERRTLLSYFHDYAQRGSATVFVHHHGLRTIHWSYARLVEESHKFARELTERGVRKGDRVLLCRENSPEWAAA